MKSIIRFIKEGRLNYEDVYDALYDYLSNGDDFALDGSATKTGTGAECLDAIGSIIDILDFHDGWDEIADNCDTDVDTLQDFIDDNEEKLIKDLEKKLS
jgi:hypothetical protein